MLSLWTSTDTRFYRAYGLTISSQIALPELDELKPLDEVTQRQVSLHISWAKVDGPMPPDDQLRLTQFSDGQAYFAWHGIGRILVRDHATVEVDLLPETDPALLSFILLGPVMAAILHGRSQLVLHGSAVTVTPGKAALFIGDNSAGKSTLAGAFLRAGHDVLNDDVIAISGADTEHPVVRPGFPAMKLSRTAIEAFAPLPGTLLPAVPENAAKLRVRFAQQTQTACPLGHIFVLERGPGIIVTPLDPSARLSTLLRHSYMLKFGVEPLRGPDAARHFAQCANIANHVPVSILTVPDGLNNVMDVADYLVSSALFQATGAV